MKLTQTSVGKITLPKDESDKIFFDDEISGFGLRVRAGGSRKWVVHYRQGGIQRRHTLGPASVLTVDQARHKARKVLVDVGEGKDPAAAKAEKRASSALIFKSVMEDYLSARQRDMKPRSHAETARHLREQWKPLHGLAVGGVSRSVVAARLRIITEQSGPIAANRARASLSAFYAWAIGEGLCEANPVIGTNKQAETNRERVLTDAELAKVWLATSDNSYGRIVRLLILTGQRREEVGGLRWKEIDTAKALIALPPDRTKNGRSHDVPLSQTALDALKAQPRIAGRDLVFGEGEGGYSGWSKSKKALDEKLGKGVSGWTLHDLRRTAATRMADIGIQPHVIEAVLNHVSGHKAGVAGIYNRASYATEKRAALDQWASHVATVVAQAQGANVTRLKASQKPAR